jgi:hypothetical protein
VKEAAGESPPLLFMDCPETKTAASDGRLQKIWAQETCLQEWRERPFPLIDRARAKGLKAPLRPPHRNRGDPPHETDAPAVRFASLFSIT